MRNPGRLGPPKHPRRACSISPPMVSARSRPTLAADLGPEWPVIVNPCAARRRGVRARNSTRRTSSTRPGIVSSTVLIFRRARSGPWVRLRAAAVRSARRRNVSSFGDPREDVRSRCWGYCRRSFFGRRRTIRSQRAARNGAVQRPHPAPEREARLGLAPTRCQCRVASHVYKLSHGKPLSPAWLRIKCRGRLT